VPRAAPFLLIALAGACTGEANAGAIADVRPCGTASDTGADAPSLPRLTGRVVDDADILPPDAEAALVQRLARIEERTSDQLIVVTTTDLKAESIEQSSLRLGNGWAIGRRDLDNGVLLIVAPNHRKTRIEVGCGLEGLLTDARAAAIIDDALLPAFREGAYPRGIAAGVEEIGRVLESDPKRPQPAPIDEVG
jgi:uncharacterized protein